MTDISGKNWHHLSAEKVVTQLESDPERGLDSTACEERRRRFGRNTISIKRTKGPLLRFLLQFHQPLIYILIASGFITAFLHEWVDSGVIFGVVLVNAVIGFIQESKAVSALTALSRTMTTEAVTVRQGGRKKVAAEELVPGDIVLLRSGDKVPADLRLLSVRELQVDESALTGESLPVEKYANPLPADTDLADRRNMAYASTLVTYGQANGIVVAIGNATEVGRISALLSSADELATPLTRKIDYFSKFLLWVILALAAITMAIGIWRGQTFFDMFMAAVALAVGAIPEGLPAAVTITLAIGVGRMARRNAIVRKLPAVETLGSTTVICSDKTGTLTENQMTVQAIWAAGVEYRLTGSGYDPTGGRLEKNGRPFEATDSFALLECLRAGVLCNDSQLLDKKGKWEVQGTPTEGALLVAAVKAGLSAAALHKQMPREDLIPFESQHKYMATLHGTGSEELGIVYLKGAAEALLEKCDSGLDANGALQPLSTAEILREIEELTANGQRVLAFARKNLPTDKNEIGHVDVAANLTFIGLQGMFDPPRKAAIAAVATCKAAGVQVKMITGDHPSTATAIAKEVGLLEGGEIKVATGRQLAALTPRQFTETAADTPVFARVSPEQKLRLVEALQAQGQVVAMTGDGVNDAPALRKADIGVAMGCSGTEVAKEAADMVLTDDNFATIEAAVEEGRGVFDNLTKFIVWTLPTNLGEGLVILVAIFLGLTLPILPVQILWINMTTAGFLGLMLAFEPKEPEIMQRQPRNPATPILTGRLTGRILLVGTLLLIWAFGLFAMELAAGSDITTARTVAVNAFVVIELFYLFNCRALSKSVLSLGFFSNPWVLIGAAAMLLLQLLYTYLPVMNRLFQSTAIGWNSWGRIAAAGLISFLVVEIEKKISGKLKTKSRQH
ncbi:MAG: cation-transporting P-type ATPase [Deltaproteobacteria bacterium]